MLGGPQGNDAVHADLGDIAAREVSHRAHRTHSDHDGVIASRRAALRRSTRRRRSHAPPEQIVAVDQHHPRLSAALADTRPRVARRTGTARTATAPGRAAARATSLKLDRRIGVGVIGQHVGDADRASNDDAYVSCVDRHRRPAPDGHERGGAESPARRCDGGSGRRRRPGACTASASCRNIGATSSMCTTCVTWIAMPASISASASSRRFSSRSSTTTSGASATIASMSGSLVPPTWSNEGCSQNRVHATTGDLPREQASR